MGAWGYSPFECDEGLDVKERWDDWISGYHAIGYDDAVKRFFEHWGDAVRYGDSITNNEIIALTFLHIDNSIELPKKLQKAAEDAINRELEEIELARWKEPEKRRDFLVQLLETIDGIRKKPKSPNIFLDPALHYRSLVEAQSKLSRAFSKLKSSKCPIGLSGAGFPEFLVTLGRLMGHRVWEKDMKIFLQARAERAMMLAAYLAIQLNYTQQELDEFLEEIRKRCIT